MTRKLNMTFAKDYAKSAGASGLAYMYEEIAGAAVVDATARDGKLSLFDIALQLAVGWGPFVLASHQGGYFWSSFAGAVAYNRIDNLMVNVAGARAHTHMGVVMPGETVAEAQARLGIA